MNAIETAIKMETDAIAFYSGASDMAKNVMGRKMFLAVAEEERRHLELLSGLLKELDITVKDAFPIGNVKTIFEELKDELLEMVEATDDELNAFKIAMDMEREGVKFYKNAATEATSAQEITLFERLAKEEEQHYTVFSNTRSFLKDSGGWFMWEDYSLLDGGTPWA